jgi:hypothetical protein
LALVTFLVTFDPLFPVSIEVVSNLAGITGRPGRIVLSPGPINSDQHGSKEDLG